MSGVNGVAAVVLNYKTWQDTVNCVNDIIAQQYPSFHIIVVENGSGNDSAVRLKALYNDDKNVTLLVSDTNLGFARGNNLGIRYAHEKLGFDTVFVVNSDTRIAPGLFSAVAGLDVTGVGAVSPTVLLPDGSPQFYPVNCENIKKHAGKTAWNLIKANIAALPVIRDFYEKRRAKKPAKALSAAPAGRRVLQGCSYFLTPDFFAHYRGLFPNTFLYWEEVDLLLMLERAGLASVAVDTPPVTHFGEGSTQKVTKSMLRFRLKHSNRSMMKSLPLIFGMSEKRIAKLIGGSPEFASEL